MEKLKARAKARALDRKARFVHAPEHVQIDEENIEVQAKSRDAEVQTTVSLPNHVAAFWNCSCPEAETVVDISSARAQEELISERPAEDQPGESAMADDASVTETAQSPERSTENTHTVGGPSPLLRRQGQPKRVPIPPRGYSLSWIGPLKLWMVTAFSTSMQAQWQPG